MIFKLISNHTDPSANVAIVDAVSIDATELTRF
jgi:hypothetical protein